MKLLMKCRIKKSLQYIGQLEVHLLSQKLIDLTKSQYCVSFFDTRLYVVYCRLQNCSWAFHLEEVVVKSCHFHLLPFAVQKIRKNVYCKSVVAICFVVSHVLPVFRNPLSQMTDQLGIVISLYLSEIATNLIIFDQLQFMTHSQMLGKFEYTRGPIFKVVLEC